MGGGRKKKDRSTIDKIVGGVEQVGKIVGTIGGIGAAIGVLDKDPIGVPGARAAPTLEAARAVVAGQLRNAGKSKKAKRKTVGRIMAAGPTGSAAHFSILPSAIANTFTTASSKVPTRTGLNREYICDVITTETFGVLKRFFWHPGNPLISPRLANIARNYERWIAHRFCLIYSTKTGFDADGGVYFGLEPDPNDDTVESKQEFMALAGACTTAVYNNCCCEPDKIALPGVNKNNSEAKYVFFGPGRPSFSLSGGVDDKEYMMGEMLMASSGTTGLRGELYVEYDVSFMNPVYREDCLCGIYGSAGTIATASPLGSTEGTHAGSIVLKWKDANELYVQASGSYYVRWYFTGTSISAISITCDSQYASLTVHRSVIGSASAWVEYHLNIFDNGETIDGIILTFVATASSSTNIGNVLVSQISDKVAGGL
jgi:hypothetical protein